MEPHNTEATETVTLSTSSDVSAAVRGGFRILRDAWNRFVEQMKPLLIFFLACGAIIFGLPLVAAVVIGLQYDASLEVLMSGGGFVGAVIAILYLLYMIVAVMIGAAQVRFVLDVARNENPAWRDAATFGIRNFHSLLWVGILQAAIVIGGLLLFVVPGIILAIRFAFAQLVFVDKGIKGSDALKKSWEMTDGIAWVVYARFIVLMLISIVLSMTSFIPLAGAVASILVITPLQMIMFWFLYNDIVRAKKENQEPKASYSGLKKFGLVLVPVAPFLFLILMFGFLIASAPDSTAEVRDNSADYQALFGDEDFDNYDFGIDGERQYDAE
jgi:hypothetical protein